MASKAFYEVLEEQIRTDLRKEIEAEVRAELTCQDNASASSTKKHEGARASIASGILETWLVTNVGKTFFSSGNRARNSYRAAQGPERATGTSASARTQTADTGARSPSRAPRYTATTIEDLCALELLRRYGAKIGDSFTENELKIAWRKAALSTHPDRFTQSDAVTQARMSAIFRELADAYDKLQTSLSVDTSQDAA